MALKVNKLSNVAGTVEHDVATMGIESGGDIYSGYWTKFPDGTFMIYGKNTTDKSLNNKYYFTINFPPEITPVYYSATASYNTDSDLTDSDKIAATFCLTESTTSIIIGVIARSGDVLSRKKVGWQAIGRWK